MTAASTVDRQRLSVRFVRHPLSQFTALLWSVIVTMTVNGWLVWGIPGAAVAGLGGLALAVVIAAFALARHFAEAAGPGR